VAEGLGGGSVATARTTQLAQQPGEPLAVRKDRQPRAEVHADHPRFLDRDTSCKCARPHACGEGRAVAQVRAGRGSASSRPCGPLGMDTCTMPSPADLLAGRQLAARPLHGQGAVRSSLRSGTPVPLGRPAGALDPSTAGPLRRPPSPPGERGARRPASSKAGDAPGALRAASQSEHHPSAGAISRESHQGGTALCPRPSA
jgi:hypothetical protein